MKLSAIIFSLLCFTFTFSANAADEKEQKAVAMVNLAIEHYKKVGKEKATIDFNDKENKSFVDGEFYIILSTMEGIAVSHPVNPKMIGNRAGLDLKDINGTYIIRSMVEVAQTNPSGGWTSYIWTHPDTKKLASKKTYVKVYDNMIFMVGYYD